MYTCNASLNTCLNTSHKSDSYDKYLLNRFCLVNDSVNPRCIPCSTRDIWDQTFRTSIIKHVQNDSHLMFTSKVLHKNYYILPSFAVC